MDSDRLIKNLIKDNFKLEYSNLSRVKLLEYLIEKINSIEKVHTKLITLVGGVASGKTTMAKELVEKLGSADFITTDDYAAKDREFRRKNYGSIEKKYDLEMYHRKVTAILTLKQKEEVKLPTYNPETGLAAAAGEENFVKKIGKVKTLIVEGDFKFSENPDLAIYFHVADETRKQNRLKRDIQERGEINQEKLMLDIEARNKLQHFPFTLNYAEEADIIIWAKLAAGSEQYEYDVYQRLV